MKKCWKILFGVIGCLAVFGLVCVILGYCLGGMEQTYRIVEEEIRWEDDWVGSNLEEGAEVEEWPKEWPVIRESHYEDLELAVADQISQIRMEIDSCQIDIEASDTDFYGIAADDVIAAQYYREGDTLIVRTVKGNRRNEKLTLYIPQSSQVSMMEIEIGGGELTAKDLRTDMLLLQAGGGQFVVERLEADKAEIQVGAGNMEIRNGELTELVVEAGVGHFSYQGSIEEEVDVTCGMGAIQMEIAGKAEDFDYEVEGALGEITVNGVLMEGKHEWRNNAEKQMELICSMGAIEVTFYENGGNEYE